ncbi:MAG: TonB-dependent receptor, partial [Candidatus Aminicenantes bacterium]|nr:TonB-dependent receptor [Candidatus Aminicenantes bacterium]
MTGRKLVSLAVGAALLALSLPVFAASPTGALKGRITDEKGAPLEGAYLYVTSPTALGVANYMTARSGRFAVVGLAPGTYKVVVEKPGFKTVTIDGIDVSSGATSTVDVEMEPAATEEEPAIAEPGSPLDRDTARYATVLDRDLISRLPLRRDLTDLLRLVPGLVFESDSEEGRMSLNGTPLTSAVLVQDGVIVTHPADGRIMDRINTDLIDEVVIESAGHDAAIGPAQGAYINVVHKPGSPRTRGSIAYSASGRGLVDSLWTAEELAEMPNAAPTSLRREHDLSFTLGGPLLEDMAWMFANLRFRNLGRRTPFTYWTDPLGVRHFVYDYSRREVSALLKLSMNVLDKFQGVLEFGSSSLKEPVTEEDIGVLRPEESTRNLDGEGTFLARVGGSYAAGQDLRIDLNVGYAKYKQPYLLNEAAVDKPEYYDVITGRSWGSGSLNDRERASRMRAGASVTRLQDGLLGVFHEFVAGGEYETTATTSSTWKRDNLIMNYADGSPYTYGSAVSPVSGEEVGWGLVGFYIAPGAADSMSLKRELKRIGLYVQDTMKIGGRLSLSVGLRFDRSEARFGAFSKAASGNSVSTSLGSTLINPILGYNLYSAISLSGWEKAIVWNNLSPRAGLSLDLWGNGRTVVKASWARIPEYLGLGYAQDLAQVDP